MGIPKPICLDASASELADEIARLPAAPGIYALSAISNRPYISCCPSLRKRLARLLLRPTSEQEGLFSRLRASISRIECWPTGSRLETFLLLYALVRSHFPEDYLRRLKLRPPWFLGLTVEDPFPRLMVVNRIPRNSGALFGPFSSRDAAQQYEQELSALFQLRRCSESLSPYPEHPGCIYGEMNQCLRPCQSAVSPEEYESETRRVAEFLSNNGKSAMGVLSAARDRAAIETDFEQAAFLHRRLEKMKGVASVRDEVISEIHQFHGVALTRDLRQGRVRLWSMANGYWREPVVLDCGEQSRAKSLDREIRDVLNAAVAGARQEGERIEHLALFSRWYYSSWRDGHWFPFRALADLNLRKLVREISNLVKAEALEAGQPEKMTGARPRGSC